MSETFTGYVQKIKIVANGTHALVYVGPAQDDVDVAILYLFSDDTLAEGVMKISMLKLLQRACAYGFEVSVTTPNDSSKITYVQAGPYEIAPNDQPVHNDFFCVMGKDFPDDAELVFDSTTTTVTVTPDLVRPHMIFLASLPDTIPTGWNEVYVTSSSGDSDAFPVDVSDKDRYVKRVFCSGAPKPYPFTLGIAANGVIDKDGTIDLYADPILGNRTDYHDIVDYAINNIFNVNETFLRQNDRDDEIRLFSIFDDSMEVLEENCLCQEDPGTTIMYAVKERVNEFMEQFDETVDQCIAFHGSTTNTRGSASRGIDDDSRGTPEAFTYDGTEYSHHPFAETPGATAIYVNNSTAKMTAIHELGHCCSEGSNGRVRDLYQDNTYTTFTVNKKWRADPSDPIPTDFANYNGTTYQSDPVRDGIGYPSTWVTYHCELTDDTVPDLMDDYTTASTSDRYKCRFDKLTSAWYTDRIRVKLDR